MKKIYLKIGEESFFAVQRYGARFFADLDAFDLNGSKADSTQYTALNRDGTKTTNSRLQARPVTVKLIYDGRSDTIDTQHATLEMFNVLCDPHNEGVLTYWSDIGSKRSIAVRPIRTLLITKRMYGMYWLTFELSADDPHWYGDEKYLELSSSIICPNNCGLELETDIIFTTPGTVSCRERTITCIQEIQNGDRVYYCGKTGQATYQKFLSNMWTDDMVGKKLLQTGSQSIKLYPGTNVITATATGKIIYKPMYNGVI